MPSIEIGRVCIKTRGREAGKKAVVLEAKDNFIVIAGPKIRKRKCNPRHLIFTNQKVSVSKDAEQKEIAKLLKE
jgi:large subunit ribosomal protein L14e